MNKKILLAFAPLAFVAVSCAPTDPIFHPFDPIGPEIGIDEALEVALDIKLTQENQNFEWANSARVDMRFVLNGNSSSTSYNSTSEGVAYFDNTARVLKYSLKGEVISTFNDVSQTYAVDETRTFFVDDSSQYVEATEAEVTALGIEQVTNTYTQYALDEEAAWTNGQTLLGFGTGDLAYDELTEIKEEIEIDPEKKDYSNYHFYSNGEGNLYIRYSENDNDRAIQFVDYQFVYGIVRVRATSSNLSMSRYFVVHYKDVEASDISLPSIDDTWVDVTNPFDDAPPAPVEPEEPDTPTEEEPASIALGGNR